MQAWLAKSAETLRSQINKAYLNRDKRSDGWIGDSKHAADPTSDHNPDKYGCVRAIDIDADLSLHKSEAWYLADQIRQCAKRDRRIKYVIYDRKIASLVSAWRWRKYRGVNPHTSHIHISFYAGSADYDKSEFNIPLLKDKN